MFDLLICNIELILFSYKYLNLYKNNNKGKKSLLHPEV